MQSQGRHYAAEIPDINRTGYGAGNSRAVTAVSFLLIALDTAPPAMFGFLGAYLRSDLHLSKGRLGLLTSVLYGCTGVSLVFAGRLCDRFGARAVSILNVGLIALAAAAMCLWPTYPVLMVAGALCGISYSLGNVATNVAVSAAPDGRRTGYRLAVKTTGIPAAMTVMALAGPTLADQLGWRSVAAIIAGCAVVSLLPTLSVLPSSRLPRGQRDRSRLPRHFWWMAAAGALFIVGSNPLLTWFVVYLHDALRVGLTTAGFVAAIGSASSAALLLTVAHLGEHLGSQRRCPTIAIACLVCAGAVALVAGGSRVGLAAVIIGGVVGVWANLVVAGLTHAAVVDRAPGAVGRASGVALTGFYVGALIAPGGFGLFTDVTGSYASSWAVCAVLLLLSAGAYLRVQALVPVVEAAPAPLLLP